MTTTTMGLRFRIENSKLVLIQSPPRPSNVASKAIKLPKAQVPKRKGPEKRRKQKQRQLLNICFSREKCPLCSKPLLRKSLPRHLANIHKVEANEVEKMMLKIAKRKSKEVEEEEEDDDDDDDILWLEDEDSPTMEAKKKPRLGSRTIVVSSSSESSSSPSSISSSSSLSSCSSLSSSPSSTSSSSSSSCSPPTTSSSSDSDSSSSSPQSSSAEVDISSDSDYYTSESVKVPPQTPLETGGGGGGFSQEKEEVEEDLKYFCHRCNQEFRLPLDLLNHNNFVHRGMRLPEEKADPNPAATLGLSISPSDHSIFDQPFADIETGPVINNSIDLLDLDGIDLSFFQEDFSTSPLEDILNFKDDDFYLKELLSSSPPPPSSPSSFLAGPSQPKQLSSNTE